MNIVATILLIAETLTYFPGNDLIPGTITTSSGSSAIVHNFQGAKVVWNPKTSKHTNSLQQFGYMCNDTPWWNKPMPKFKGDKKCSICRGRGKLGRNDCKCVRKQQEAWKKDRDTVLKANPQLKGSK